MYFPDRGCVRTLAPYMYTPLTSVENSAVLSLSVVAVAISRLRMI